MVVRHGVVVRHRVAERDDPDPDPDHIDRLFHALADRTRRDIVRLVLHTELSVSSLAGRYPMSFAAVQKHVAVLERAQLIQKRRQGREQMVRGDIEMLRTVNQLLDRYEAIWRSRVDQMDQILAEADPGSGIDHANRTNRTTKERKP